MVENKREYGELPKILSGVSQFPCEVCATTKSSCYSGVAQITEYFSQCPECGRWVCSDCWDKDAIVCNLCAREIPGDEASEIREELEDINSRISAIEELEENEEIRTRISAIEDFLQSFKKCKKCDAVLINPKAKFCGICGSDNLKNGPFVSDR